MTRARLEIKRHLKLVRSVLFVVSTSRKCGLTHRARPIVVTIAFILALSLAVSCWFSVFTSLLRAHIRTYEQDRGSPFCAPVVRVQERGAWLVV